MRNFWFVQMLFILAVGAFFARPAHASGLVAQQTIYKTQQVGNVSSSCINYPSPYGTNTGMSGDSACQTLLPLINCTTAGHTITFANARCEHSQGNLNLINLGAACPANSVVSGSNCLCNSGFDADPTATSCVPACVAETVPEFTVTYAGFGVSTICNAADLCVYTTGSSITTGEGAEPPNPMTTSWVSERTAAHCTAATGGGAGGCPSGQANVGFGCMTYTENQAILDALANPAQFVDPCIAAGTCTPAADPCIAAGTCTGTGTGAGGTIGTTGVQGTSGGAYVDPCIIAGTCTAPADPCIAAGTCTGQGTGAGGTAGGVNPCIAAGTCAGSGAGTGSGTGGATEATQRDILKQLKGTPSLFSGLGTVPVDGKIGVEGITVTSSVLDFLSTPVCPAPITYSVLNMQKEISYQPACDFLENMRPLVLAFASITVLLIYIRGFTPS